MPLCFVSGDESSLPRGRPRRRQDPLPPARLRVQLAALEGRQDDPDDGRRGQQGLRRRLAR